MKVSRETIVYGGHPVGSIYTVEELERGDFPRTDPDFLDFVAQRKEFGFINGFTLETLHSQLRGRFG